jgi:hypothetical protein
MATDSEFARQGTAAHTLADWARRQRRSAWDFIGQVIRVPHQGSSEVQEFKIDIEMAEAVDAYVEYCEDFGGDAAFFELRVRYDAWVPGGFGTSDDIRIRFRDDVCKVTDLKYGQGKPVYAKGNPQNRLYGLGVYHDLGWLHPIKKFELGIFQPRLGIIDTETVTTEELLHWADTVARPGAQLALQPNAPFKAGDHCQFCAIKKTCKVRAKSLTDVAVNRFEDLDNGEVHTEVKNFSELTPDEMYDIHLMAPAIRKLLDDIEDWGMGELQNGRPFGKHKLVAGKGYRYYEDETAAGRMLFSILGEDAYTEPQLLSPAQAEKKIGKHHAFMAEHVRKGTGKPTMVGPEDKRPALQTTQAQDFEMLDPA